jgi:hypothetical protein
MDVEGSFSFLDFGEKGLFVVMGVDMKLMSNSCGTTHNFHQRDLGVRIH